MYKRQAERSLQDLLLGQIRAGRVGAAHDLSEGGLLVAVCEMLFGHDNLGAALDLSALESARQDALLFGESQGRVVISVAGADVQAVLAAARASGVPADPIGEVTAGVRFAVRTATASHEWSVPGLRAGWETSIETAMKRPGLG